ncbi:hypothetical protein EYF80_024470 [Liparis tanakae]|uniref:Uncharacterized protein n=1 Tax=Liparis tanakae TaxID=230148 RepID=A0A4Z2HHS8_9TELE|nr:hypothetical protein EYF80_024470 [Liparis tanakae]
MNSTLIVVQLQHSEDKGDMRCRISCSDDEAAVNKAMLPPAGRRTLLLSSQSIRDDAQWERTLKDSTNLTPVQMLSERPLPPTRFLLVHLVQMSCRPACRLLELLLPDPVSLPVSISSWSTEANPSIKCQVRGDNFSPPSETLGGSQCTHSGSPHYRL